MDLHLNEQVKTILSTQTKSPDSKLADGNRTLPLLSEELCCGCMLWDALYGGCSFVVTGRNAVDADGVGSGSGSG